MLKLAFALVPALVATPLAAQITAAPAPAALVLAREIVTLGFPDDQNRRAQEAQAQAYIKQMRDAMTARYADPGLRQIIGDYIEGLPPRFRAIAEQHRPLAREALIKAYAREFPIAELEQIAGFMRTDAGRHFFQRSSAILADPDVAAANQAYVTEIARSLAASQSELETRAQAYMAKHPEAASGSVK